MTSKKGDVWVLHIDGASRGNPGSAGSGATLVKGDSRQKNKCVFLGKRTNNEAEYWALLLGLFLLKKYLKADDKAIIYSDSQLLVRQMNGEYKVKDKKLIRLYSIAKKCLSDDPSCSIRHIPRAENEVADELANKAIDDKVKPSQNFLAFIKKHADI